MKKLLLVMAVIVAGLTSCEKHEILVEPIEETDSLSTGVYIEQWVETETIDIYIEL